MPYKTDRQRKFFNSPTGKEKLGEKVVHEFNEASKGMELIEHTKGSPKEPHPKSRYTDMMKG